MSLSSGTRLGHSNVTALLDEEGLGQVWRVMVYLPVWQKYKIRRPQGVITPLPLLDRSFVTAARLRLESDPDRYNRLIRSRLWHSAPAPVSDTTMSAPSLARAAWTDLAGHRHQLNRQVALKVRPDGFAADPDRLQLTADSQVRLA
jgi:hypothetical protein